MSGKTQTQRYTYNLDESSLSDWGKNFTSRIGDGTGPHEEQFTSVMELITSCKPNAKFLDIGCGFGRFIELVKHHVGSLVGLEPDLERFQYCFDAHHGDRIQIINSTSLEYKKAHPEDRFDIIALSMVLQHVSTTTCEQILCDVHDLLAPEGVAIIATTQQNEEQFAFTSDPTPRNTDEFNRYAMDTANQPFGIPVRRFSKASFHRVIEQAGLHIIHWGQFSYILPEKLSDFATRYGVLPEDLKDVAVSQYAVAKRTVPPSRTSPRRRIPTF